MVLRSPACIVVLAQLGQLAGSSDKILDLWRRPNGLEQAELSYYADYTRYTAFEDIEPYVHGSERIEISNSMGESFLVRRKGPGPADFDISASCWTEKRTPLVCCLQEGGQFCPLPPEYIHRCCTASGPETDEPDEKSWYRSYIMFSKDLSWEDRLAWDGIIPKTLIDEAAFDIKRLRWRVGRHEPWDLCPSTIDVVRDDAGLHMGTAESSMAVKNLVKLLLAVEAASGNMLTRSVVNVGAGTCGTGDPLYSLLHSPEGRGFVGLFIDANSSDLAACQQNVMDSTATSVRLLNFGVEPKTVAAHLKPHLEELFFGYSSSDFRKWPLDLLVIDIDGCDCQIAEELMQVVRPKILVIELAFHFPPPFRFAAQHDSVHSAEWLAKFDVRMFNPIAGCSLSHAVHRFSSYGMHLLRLVDQDAIFVHNSVKEIFERGYGVRFPQDEFLCYRRSRLQVQLPMHFVREWFFADHPADSLASIWRNVTQLQHAFGRTSSPFLLDY